MGGYALGIIFTCIFIGVNTSSFIDSLPKCSIHNSNCQKDLIQGIIRNISKTGIPSLGIPPVDPLMLENVTVMVSDSVKMSLNNGTVTGISNCVFTKYSIDIEKGRGSQEIMCTLVIAGHYSVEAASPMFEALLGGSDIHANGNAKVKIEKLLLEYNYPVYVKRKDDGEIYISCKYSKTADKFDILGDMTFAADNIYIGKRDISDIAVALMNQSGKSLMKASGKAFIDEGTKIYRLYLKQFFDVIPARKFILEDLTQYLSD